MPRKGYDSYTYYPSEAAKLSGVPRAEWKQLFDDCLVNKVPPVAVTTDGVRGKSRIKNNNTRGKSTDGDKTHLP